MFYQSDVWGYYDPSINNNNAPMPSGMIPPSLHVGTNRVGLFWFTNKESQSYDT